MTTDKSNDVSPVDRPTPNRGGRPRKPIDRELVRKLSAIQCTYAEIASVVGISERTVQRRFGSLIHEAREAGKTSLRRAMWKRALDGSERMLTWLSIQHLGMRHHAALEHSGPDGGVIPLPVNPPLTVEERTRRIEAIMGKVIARRAAGAPNGHNGSGVQS